MESWLDRAFVKVMRHRPFFSDGWGDPDRLDVVTRLPTDREDVAPIAVDWSPWEGQAGVEVREGVFASPEGEVLGLPLESRHAVVRHVRPHGLATGPLCLHLAATGEFGFKRRMRLALPLARAGIASLLLENPYYGTRAPPEQHGSSVRTVADLLVMGRACVQEARSLLAWFHAQGHGTLGVSGFSMGGQTAAMTAASCPFPVAAVPLAGSHSATAVFLDGVLRYVVDWTALAPGGDQEAARERLKTLLSALSVASLPPPIIPQCCILVSGSQDAFVQPHSTRLLQGHWPGAELRWIKAGHVGGYLWGQRHYRGAIVESLQRLEAALDGGVGFGGTKIVPSGV